MNLEESHEGWDGILVFMISLGPEFELHLRWEGQVGEKFEVALEAGSMEFERR